jgi:probable F420-dependent oxidoreductase
LKIGITLPQLGTQATRKNLTLYAKKVENSGFDSVWVLERLLWPINPQTPYPVTPDGSLPLQYQSVLDPIDTLSFVAANTEKIFLGTSVIDAPFHSPVDLGKRFSTLDALSKGRAICGLGIGWSKDEYQASNVSFKNRGKRADEFVQAIRRTWTEEIVEFRGEYYNIPASKIGPKPTQKPHIPIYLGGFSPNTFSRIVNFGANGWLGVLFGPLGQLQQTVDMFKGLASRAKKDPNTFKVILLTNPNVFKTKDSGGNQRFPMTGTIEEIASDVRKIKDMGIDHIILGFFFSPIYSDIDETIEISKQLMRYAK